MLKRLREFIIIKRGESRVRKALALWIISAGGIDEFEQIFSNSSVDILSPGEKITKMNTRSSRIYTIENLGTIRQQNGRGCY